MASPISAWGEWNPNATRVSRRILVLVDSTSALDNPWVNDQTIPARCRAIFLANAANAGIRHRLAHASHASSSATARGPLTLKTSRSSSFSR
jgi:hypothetical protein